MSNTPAGSLDEADRASERQPAMRGAPEVVAPTNRINVALPFSTIQTHEPSRELGELAVVVARLADLVQRLAPGNEAKKLHEQAQRLAAQLRQ